LNVAGSIESLSSFIGIASSGRFTLNPLIVVESVSR